jgi:hypothetical protein
MAMEVVNKECPNFPSVDDRSRLLVVLTRDEVGKYAAYAGIVPRSMGGHEPDAIDDYWSRWVRDRGMKLQHAHCLQYFPFVPKDDYRI